ncbi:MAG: STAS domain-containing protein [Betaproteobacteria bacterium]|nr:STAS domain-containing protein [Betaproteobacteria bacterium]MBI2958948.1 STAS domain-containing protein [Betaproteobacteria bacterium]
MLTRQGDALMLEGPVTFDSVPALVGAAEEHFRGGVSTIDFSRVTDIDSSAVALALEWLRQGARANLKVRFVNLPQSMHNLGKLYGVSEILASALA